MLHKDRNIESKIERTEDGFYVPAQRLRVYGGFECLERILDKEYYPYIKENPEAGLNDLIGLAKKSIPLTGVHCLVKWRQQEGLLTPEQLEDPVNQKIFSLLEEWRLHKENQRKGIR